MEEKKQQLTLFKVRDLRKKDQFKIDDAYLNSWARYCGVNATGVYTSLCRHAEFESQKAFPSQNKIAFELGISVASVKRGIKKLIKYNIIRIEKEKMQGKFSNNIYYLLDKSEWKPAIAHRDTRHRSSKTVAHQPPTAGDTQKDNKEQRITNNKDNKEDMQSRALQTLSGFSKKEIDFLIDKFKTVNPFHQKLFGMPPQRKAMAELLEKFGKEKLEKLLDALPDIVKQPTAPRITTPYQLMANFGKLGIFLQQQRSIQSKYQIGQI